MPVLVRIVESEHTSLHNALYLVPTADFTPIM